MHPYSTVFLGTTINMPGNFDKSIQSLTIHNACVSMRTHGIETVDARGNRGPLLENVISPICSCHEIDHCNPYN